MKVPYRLLARLSCLFLLAGSADAHEVRPAFLELKESAKGEFDVLWKVPSRGGAPLAGEEIPHEPPITASVDPKAPKTMPCGCPVPTLSDLMRGTLPIHPSLPEGIERINDLQVTRIEGAEIKRWTVRAGPEGLEGGTIQVHGLSATMVDVLVRVELLDGRVVSKMLRPDSPSFVFSAKEAGPSVGNYFVLGVEHILFGIDHLLFVLALVLIVRGVSLLVKTITAFTIAHSITLALATLGVVNVPSAPVEAVIALSIVFIAVEIVRSQRGQVGLTARAPWIVAFTFGLLHGFGFAGALGEVGLPANEIPLALLLFNVGVEAGQLAFIGAVIVVITLAKQGLRQFQSSALNCLHSAPATSGSEFSSRISLLPPYAIGSLAMFWVIQRISVL